MNKSEKLMSICEAKYVSKDGKLFEEWGESLKYSDWDEVVKVLEKHSDSKVSDSNENTGYLFHKLSKDGKNAVLTKLESLGIVPPKELTAKYVK